MTDHLRRAEELLCTPGVSSSTDHIIAAARVHVMIAQVEAMREGDRLLASQDLGLSPEVFESPPQIFWRNHAVQPETYGHGTADPPHGVAIEITRTEAHAGHQDIWFVPLPGRPAEPERIDPAIAELLDRAADLLGSSGVVGHDTSWDSRASQWMTDWRAYMHSSYHRRQPW